MSGASHPLCRPPFRRWCFIVQPLPWMQPCRAPINTPQPRAHHPVARVIVGLQVVALVRVLVIMVAMAVLAPPTTTSTRLASCSHAGQRGAHQRSRHRLWLPQARRAQGVAVELLFEAAVTGRAVRRQLPSRRAPAIAEALEGVAANQQAQDTSNTMRDMLWSAEQREGAQDRGTRAARNKRRTCGRAATWNSRRYRTSPGLAPCMSRAVCRTFDMCACLLRDVAPWSARRTLQANRGVCFPHVAEPALELAIEQGCQATGRPRLQAQALAPRREIWRGHARPHGLDEDGDCLCGGPRARDGHHCGCGEHPSGGCTRRPCSRLPPSTASSLSPRRPRRRT